MTISVAGPGPKDPNNFVGFVIFRETHYCHLSFVERQTIVICYFKGDNFDRCHF